jgi:hypothetical protein
LHDFAPPDQQEAAKVLDILKLVEHGAAMG